MNGDGTRLVRVQRPTNLCPDQVQHGQVASVTIQEGHLMLLDSSGEIIGAHAPGDWRYFEPA